MKTVFKPRAECREGLLWTDDADGHISSLLSEVVQRRTSLLVAVVGNMGTGKTTVMGDLVDNVATRVSLSPEPRPVVRRWNLHGFRNLRSVIHKMHLLPAGDLPELHVFEHDDDPPFSLHRPVEGRLPSTEEVFVRFLKEARVLCLKTSLVLEMRTVRLFRRAYWKRLHGADVVVLLTSVLMGERNMKTVVSLLSDCDRAVRELKELTERKMRDRLHKRPSLLVSSRGLVGLVTGELDCVVEWGNFLLDF